MSKRATRDILMLAVAGVLALWVLSATVPVVPSTGPERIETIDPVLTPPAIPIPVPDPIDDGDVIAVVCTDHGPPFPPPPTTCPPPTTRELPR